MLKPSIDRLDYGNLLLPPPNYQVDLAVGTTYSLDFDALVGGACMALGLEADTDSALLQNPIYLLETLRRTEDKITLFAKEAKSIYPGETLLYTSFWKR